MVQAVAPVALAVDLADPVLAAPVAPVADLVVPVPVAIVLVGQVAPAVVPVCPLLGPLIPIAKRVLVAVFMWVAKRRRATPRCSRRWISSCASPARARR